MVPLRFTLIALLSLTTVPRPGSSPAADPLSAAGEPRIASIQDLGLAADGRVWRLTSSGLAAAPELEALPTVAAECACARGDVRWTARNDAGVCIGVERALDESVGAEEPGVVAIVCVAGARRELSLPGQRASEPFAIDGRGRVVGRWVDETGAYRAFLDDGSRTFDLASLVRGADEIVFRAAHDVDEFGRILAVAEIEGAARLVLLRLARESSPGSSTVLLPPGGIPISAGAVAPAPPFPFGPGAFEPAFPCEDWGFESGAFGGWSCLHSTLPAALAPQICGTGPTAITLVGDPLVATIPQVPPNGGGFAVRIGDAADGRGRDAIERTFVVTPELAQLKYMYAWVLENPTDESHNPQGQPNLRPYFDALFDVPSSGAVIDHLHEDGGTLDAFVVDVGSLRVRRWSCRSVDLSAFVGQTVRARFESADCGLGAHYGFAFVDFPCRQRGVELSVPARVCGDDAIPASGSANAGTLEFVWSVEELDAAGQPVAGSQRTLAGSGAPGDIEVRAFYQAAGAAIVCGRTYLVRLAVRNECEGWVERSRSVRVLCRPVADAGPDRFVCAPATNPVTLTAQSLSNDWRYRWYHGSTLVGQGSSIAVQPTSTTTYRLEVRHRLMATCVAIDEVTVRVLGPFQVQIDACPCGGSTALTSSIAGDAGDGLVYTWSPGGQHSPTLTVHPAGPTTYTLTVQGPCFTASASVLVGGAPTAQLIAPNSFTPNGDGLNDEFIIYHLGMGAGDRPAYDAIEWRFLVFNRWGTLLRTMSGSAPPCGSLANGDVPRWDGRNDNGKLLHRNRVYVYRLDVLRCGSSQWSTARIERVTLLY